MTGTVIGKGRDSAPSAATLALDVILKAMRVNLRGGPLGVDDIIGAKAAHVQHSQGVLINTPIVGTFLIKRLSDMSWSAHSPIPSLHTTSKSERNS
jgi:hypothetical protein